MKYYWTCVIPLFWFGAGVRGDVIYVDNGVSTSGDGTSWAQAHKYLQDGLAGAASTDPIWVVQGTYRPDESDASPSGTGNRADTFQLITGVELYGGFGGSEIVLEDRDVEMNVTILSGDLSGNDVDPFMNRSDNSYHVVTGSGTDNTAILDGFTVSGGNANGTDPHDRGGGMLNISGGPTVANCVMLDSEADSGGGMYNDGNSAPTVTDCTVRKNRADVDGGGLCFKELNAGHVSITDTDFFENEANVGLTGKGGGGMYVGPNNAGPASSMTLTRCDFDRNTARDGGGVYSDGPDATFTLCRFTENTALPSSGGGAFAFVLGDPPSEVSFINTMFR